MEQIRSILLRRSMGQSIRKIAIQMGYSRNTIRSWLRVVEQEGRSVSSALELDDEALGILLFDTTVAEPQDERYQPLIEKLPEYYQDFKNEKHVTRQILWEEYREEYPGGYGYTRFCHHFNQYARQGDVTAIFEHTPGEKMQIDFAGDTLSYIDPDTGQIVFCPVLVAVLPSSSYIYAEAVVDQKQEHLVKGLSNALGYVGGVPGCLISDNLKSAVKKSDRYEPSFTELIDQLCLHYQTSFMATRPKKPRDKATVEASVRVVYQRIYSRIRNKQAFSLAELNGHIHDALKELNGRNFKGRDYSREHLFIHHEQPHLKPLPTTDFVVKKTVCAKVQRNYHIILGQDRHQYSVPWQYTGKQVKVVYTTDDVEIYCDYKRIALHRRSYRKHGYSTLPGHMPPNHQAIMEQKGWDAAYFIRKAEQCGPDTKQAVSQMLQSKAFPEQTYNACLGILRLGGKYGNDRLEKACSLVVGGPKINYGILKNILQNNMDKRITDATATDFKTPVHDNIRGPQQLLF